MVLSEKLRIFFVAPGSFMVWSHPYLQLHLLPPLPLYFVPQHYWVTWYSLKVLWCLKRFYLGLTAWEIPSLLRQLSSSAASLWNPSLTLPADLGLFFSVFLFHLSVGEKGKGRKGGREGGVALWYRAVFVCVSVFPLEGEPLEDRGYLFISALLLLNTAYVKSWVPL